MGFLGCRLSDGAVNPRSVLVLLLSTHSAFLNWMRMDYIHPLKITLGPVG